MMVQIIWRRWLPVPAIQQQRLTQLRHFWTKAYAHTYIRSTYNRRWLMTITCQLKNLTSLFRLVLSRSLLSKYTPPEVLSSKLSSQDDPVPTLKFARWSWCRHSHFGWIVSLSIHPPMSKSHSQIQAGTHIFHWSDLPQWSVHFPHNCHENRPDVELVTSRALVVHGHAAFVLLTRI